MEVNKILVCRFCLNVCKDDFEYIESTIENLVNSLLPVADLSIVHEPVVCNSCVYNFKQCFNFKKQFLHKRGFTYNDNKDVNLIASTEIVNENATLASEPSSGSDVCLFCMEVENLKTFAFVKQEEEYPASMLKKYFADVDIDIPEDSPICTSCHKTLQGHLTFLNNCIRVEEEIRDYCKCGGNNIKGQIELDSVVQFMTNRMLNNTELNAVKLEEEVEKLNNNYSKEIENEFVSKLADPGFCIKSEDIEIKADVQDSQDGFDVDVDSMGQPKAETEEADSASYSCKLCVYSAEDKHELKKHMRAHKAILQAPEYRCDKCPFNTRYKYSHLRHILSHKSDSEVILYNCSQCTYNTRFKRNLVTHMLVHNNLSEVKMYKCELCPYETKHKYYLPMHMVKHQPLSEVETFACDMCTFRTKRKWNLKTHMLFHKGIHKEVTMYKCEVCEHQSKNKYHLLKHTLNHKSDSEVVMYKCENCPFQTRHKSNLQSHLLLHKSDSEVRLYKCDRCAFQTRHRHRIISHVHTHKSITYPCSVCPYKARHKAYLTRHMLTHHIRPKVATGTRSRRRTKKV